MAAGSGLVVFVAVRDLRAAKGRFGLMAVVIVLITLLVGFLSGLTEGLARAGTSAVTDLPADHLVFAAPAGESSVSFGDSRVDQALWQRWAAVPGVVSARPVGVAMVKAQIGAASTVPTVDVAAFGVQPGSGLVPGGADVRDGGVVLTVTGARDLTVGVGDAIMVSGRPKTVVAVAGDVTYTHAPVMWVSLNDWQVLGGFGSAEPQATVIALTTKSADLAAADKQLGTKTVATSAARSAVGAYTAEHSSLQLMIGFLYAISALVIGAFFTVWTIQRSGDVAVLKALGASTGYLLRDALGQALVMLVTGTAVGALVAAGLGRLVSGGSSGIPFVLNVGTVLVPMIVMVLLGAVGAGLAIRRVTSVDPLTALGSVR